MENLDMNKVLSFFDLLKDLAKEYHDFKKDKKTLGFNVFALTSERYYLENYHSDILKAFLDPSEKHGEGNLFLKQFLKLIGVNDFEPYKDAIVTRGKQNIDILIKSKSGKRAIIIENKINNAADTNNQIPSYYEAITKQGYIVDKIIYIPLDKDKYPDRSTWDTSYENEIKDSLVHMPACLDSGEVSLNKWIEGCINNSKNDINSLILNQYLDLVKFLVGGKNMEDKHMRNFYEKLSTVDVQTVIGMRDMLKKLPTHLESRIRNRYKERTETLPFKHISNYNNGTIFSGYNFDKHEFKLEIYCDIDKYVIDFKEKRNNDSYNIKENFKDIAGLLDFVENKTISSISKNFCNDEKKSLSDFEDYLCKFIDSLLEELKNKN